MQSRRVMGKYLYHSPGCSDCRQTSCHPGGSPSRHVPCVLCCIWTTALCSLYFVHLLNCLLYHIHNVTEDLNINSAKEGASWKLEKIFSEVCGSITLRAGQKDHAAIELLKTLGHLHSNALGACLNFVFLDVPSYWLNQTPWEWNFPTLLFVVPQCLQYLPTVSAVSSPVSAVSSPNVYSVFFPGSTVSFPISISS